MKIGIDIGGTNVAAGLVDEQDRIILKNKIETRSYQAPETVIGRIGDAVQSLLEEARIEAGDLTHIGVGCAGLIDRTNGEVAGALRAGYMWIMMPYVQLWESSLQAPGEKLIPW